MVQRVGGYVRYRDEKCPFEEENTGSGQSEHRVLENPDIRPNVLLHVRSHNTLFTSFGSVVGSKARAYEEIGNAEEEKQYECQDPCCPFETDERKEALEHQGEDNSTN